MVTFKIKYFLLFFLVALAFKNLQTREQQDYHREFKNELSVLDKNIQNK